MFWRRRPKDDAIEEPVATPATDPPHRPADRPGSGRRARVGARPGRLRRPCVRRDDDSGRRPRRARDHRLGASADRDRCAAATVVRGPGRRSPAGSRRTRGSGDLVAGLEKSRTGFVGRLRGLPRRRSRRTVLGRRRGDAHRRRRRCQPGDGRRRAGAEPARPGRPRGRRPRRARRPPRPARSGRLAARARRTGAARRHPRRRRQRHRQDDDDRQAGQPLPPRGPLRPARRRRHVPRRGHRAARDLGRPVGCPDRRRMRRARTRGRWSSTPSTPRSPAGIDIVIADTAGRLHTKVNLMDELAKVRRVVDRRLPGGRPETLFVLDATTGQNGLAQALAFHDAVGLTGHRPDQARLDLEGRHRLRDRAHARRPGPVRRASASRSAT